MKTLLRGGTVVSGSGSTRADVLIEDEKIVRVAPEIPAEGSDVVDVTGRLLFPGFIDAHTHFDLDVCNTTTADDFASGTLSAVCGGTTTVVDFACPEKGQTLDYGLRLWHEKADGRCFCDYGFHMTVDDWNDGIRAELPEMFRQGVSSFKMYMTYPAMMLREDEHLAAMKEIAKLGGITGMHCEDSAAIDAKIAELKQAGRLAPSSHPLSRPASAEAAAVKRFCELAEQANALAMVVHLSAKESLDAVRAARARGVRVCAETCPQYLLLDDSVYSAADYDTAAGFVCAPPIRKKEDADALWKALEDGEIRTVSTDHCSFTRAQKEAGRGDFTKIPGGLPGAETRGILLYAAGVAAGKISAQTMCRVLSENPAKLYGMFPQKGVIAPGADADLVVLDPEASGVISAKTLHSRAGYTPFEGTPVRGRIEKVYLRGALAAQNGEPVGQPRGRFIPRGRPRTD